MATKRFHLGHVLTVTTGRMLIPDGFKGVYDVLNHLTGDSLFTHQLPRAFDECGPVLLARFPELGGQGVTDALAKLDELLAVTARADVQMLITGWLAVLSGKLREYYDLEPIPRAAHARIDPMVEAATMNPNVIEVRR